MNKPNYKIVTCKYWGFISRYVHEEKDDLNEPLISLSGMATAFILIDSSMTSCFPCTVVKKYTACPVAHGSINSTESLSCFSVLVACYPSVIMDLPMYPLQAVLIQEAECNIVLAQCLCTPGVADAYRRNLEDKSRKLGPLTAIPGSNTVSTC